MRIPSRQALKSFMRPERRTRRCDSLLRWQRAPALTDEERSAVRVALRLHRRRFQGRPAERHAETRLSRAALSPRRFAVPLFRMWRQEPGRGIVIFDVPAMPTGSAGIVHDEFSGGGRDAEGGTIASTPRTRRSGVSHEENHKLPCATVRRQRRFRK